VSRKRRNPTVAATGSVNGFNPFRRHGRKVPVVSELVDEPIAPERTAGPLYRVGVYQYQRTTDEGALA
jgi:hypothetical protein